MVERDAFVMQSDRVLPTTPKLRPSYGYSFGH
jgi:hypothetical protein